MITTRRKSRGLSTLKLNRASRFAQGLVGWLPMGNRACYGSDTMLDLSPVGNHGTLVNGPTWVGDQRLALKFDNVDDRVDFSSNIITGADRPIAIATWIQQDAGGNNRFVFANSSSSGPNILLTLSSTSTVMRFYSGDYAADSSVFTFDSGWHHYVWVWESNDTVRYFRDGVAIGTTSRISSGSTTGAASLGTNTELVGFGFLLDGRLDHFCLYKQRSLTEGEIRQIFVETYNGGYGSLAMGRRTIVNVPAAAPAVRANFLTLLGVS